MKLRKMTYIIFSWALVLIVLGLIFRLSAQNAEESKEFSDSLVSKILQWINLYIDGELLRNFAHLLEFTALSFSLNNAISVTWEKKMSGLISFAVTVIIAAGDEIHQIFVPGRAFQFSDLLIDGIGAIIGVIAYTIIYKMFSMIKERGNKNGSVKTI